MGALNRKNTVHVCVVKVVYEILMYLSATVRFQREMKFLLIPPLKEKNSRCLTKKILKDGNHKPAVCCVQHDCFGRLQIFFPGVDF